VCEISDDAFIYYGEEEELGPSSSISLTILVAILPHIHVIYRLYSGIYHSTYHSTYIYTMVHIIVHGARGSRDALELQREGGLAAAIAEKYELQPSSFYITSVGGLSLNEDNLDDGDSVVVRLKVRGGIDFQHREGSKVSVVH
jgi:hypothetical protein